MLEFQGENTPHLDMSRPQRQVCSGARVAALHVNFVSAGKGGGVCGSAREGVTGGRGLGVPGGGGASGVAGDGGGWD